MNTFLFFNFFFSLFSILILFFSFYYFSSIHLDSNPSDLIHIVSI